MKEVVELSIMSFRGSINGEHYYGSFRVVSKCKLVDNGRGGQSMSWGSSTPKHPLDGRQIERKIGPREVAYLNKKDAGGIVQRSGVYRSGDSTNRFNDVPSIMAKAIAEFPKLFDADDVLVMDKDSWASGVYIALAGPPDVSAYLNAHPDYSEQHKFLMANGYLLIDAQGMETA